MHKKYSMYHSSSQHRRKSFRVLIVVAVLLLMVAALSRPLGSAAKIPAATKSDAPRQQAITSKDGVWRSIDQKDISDQARPGAPRAYRTLSLDRVRLARILAAAPLEFSKAKTNQVELTLPLADGAYQSFRVVESPIMKPALAAKYPDIRTYRGQSLDDASTITRFDWTPNGFHALILSSEGTVLIEPYAPNDQDNYIVYFQRDVPVTSVECDVSEAEQEAAFEKTKASDKLSPQVFSGANLRTYRLAVGATAEYTQTYGAGSVAGGLSAVTTTVNFVDAIYERDVAIRLMLVANEDSIIYTDSATDGYTSDNASALINENQTKLDSIIGSANYDIGHVFDGRSQGGGFSFQGVAALGVVCRDGLKARGVSITRSVSP